MKRFALLALLLLLALPALAQDAPAFGDLPAGEWTRIPVPEAVCLYNTDYSFFVRPAEVETSKVMIYFEGGGACWDGFTCASKGQFASQFDVKEDDVAVYTAGMFDYSNPDNPVSDYHAVFLPYCSGDVHSGASTQTFDVPAGVDTQDLNVEDGKITIEFQGFENASKVLEWVYANFVTPEQVFVAGCSAGGYGASTHAPFIMNHYSDTEVVMFSDAANGVSPRNWEGFNTWDIFANNPEFIDSLAGITGERYNTTLRYREMAKAFPNNRFAQFNSFLDTVQVGFYGLLIGTPVSQENFPQIGPRWATQMWSNILSLETVNPNFYSYTAGGLLHCITPDPAFYEYTVQGVRFDQWVKSLLDGTADKSPTCDISLGECTNPPTSGE